MRVTSYKNDKNKKMDDYVKSGAYKWKIAIPLNCDHDLIRCEGGAKIDKNSGKLNISVPDFQGNGRHILVVIENKNDIEIYSFPMNVQRCYARITGNYLIVSNIAKSLMKENEKIRLNGEVLLRQISNLFAPLDDLFGDIKLLDASSIFRVINNEIIFKESQIKPIKSTTSSVQEYIISKYDRICKEGKPLAVLLSAGIDSRLNLALCHYFSKKYRNEIVVYHEYKDRKEHDIAKHIADELKLPFVSISRDRFKNEPLEYILSPEFISFHGGIYRDTLARWFSYMDVIKLSNPDATIIGLAGDPHKGKFYRDIHHLPNDLEKMLKYRMKDEKIAEEKDFMPYLSNEKTDEFFSSTHRRALISSDPCFQTDFIFYHVQAAQQSASRSPFFHLNYKIPFPLNDDHFLSMAFSLPKKEKMDAAISLNLIEKINPTLNRIPYHSGNAGGFRNRYENLMIEIMSMIVSKEKSSSRRDEDVRWNHPSIVSYLGGASSDITEKLERFIRANLGKRQKNGRIRVECALRVYLFLRQVEKELGINFFVNKES
ncbi:MAG: Asparagine synthetase protein [Patescibacteria group bacterium]|nr:Asparagine synthetase protein [Patescibacteria group bacterium]